MEITLKRYTVPVLVFLLFVNLEGVAYSNLVRLIPVMGLFLIFFKGILYKHLNWFFNAESYICIWLLVLIIGVLRSGHPEVSLLSKGMAIVSLFCIIGYNIFVFKRIGILRPIKSFFIYIYFPIVCLVCLNLLLYFLGIYDRSVNIGNAVLLEYFGVYVDRVQFALFQGINSYGAFLGFLLVISLVGLFSRIEGRFSFLLGGTVAIISLALTDSRGPLIYSLIVFFIIRFFYFDSKSPRFVWLVPLIGFIGPLLLLSFLGIAASSEYGELLSRSSGDLETGNSRSIIWFIALEDFSSFKMQHLFGYGNYGHFSAGLSQNWSYLFGKFNGGDLMHPHNTLISIVLDYGYFGLALFVFFQYSILKAIRDLWTKHHDIALIVLSGLIYLNLVGIGETMFGFYYQGIMYLYIIFFGFIFALRCFGTFSGNSFGSISILK